MKKKNIWILTFITLLVLLTAGCGTKIEKRPQMDGAEKWTVLIYMCPGEDESDFSLASEAIESMHGVDFPSNVEVLLQTGGASQWENEDIIPETSRYRVQKKNLLALDAQPVSNMGDYNTLADFIDWGVLNFPAQHYALVLWGGGAGAHGVLSDSLYNNDTLTLSELSYALSRSRQIFDFIGFDGGMMASLETASALSPYARYMTASQEIQPGVSWDYKTMFELIASNPSISGLDIGRIVCDTYYQKCVDAGFESMAAMSVTDLSTISGLTLAFDGMAGQMVSAQSSVSTLAELTRNIDNVQRFGGSTPIEGYSNMLDLGDLAVKINSVCGNTAVMVTDALAQSVVYQVRGALKANASGLSVYYPIYQDNDELAAYLDFEQSSNYNIYLRNYCMDTGIDYGYRSSYENSKTWKQYNDELYLMTSEGFLNSSGIYEMNIQGNMNLIKKITLDRYIYNGQVDSFFYICSDSDFSSNWEGGVFTDKLGETKLPMLNGRPVTIYLADVADTYKIYSVPVVYKNKTAALRFLCTYNGSGEPEYQILYVWFGLNSQNKTAYRTLGKIKFGEKFFPLFMYREPGQDETAPLKFFTDSPLRAGFGGLKLRLEKAKEGGYMFKYDINDIYNQHRNPRAVLMDIVDGEIKMTQ